MELGTGKNLELFGDRIVVQLDELPDHTVTESGILEPLNELYETDGGVAKAKTSDRKHLAQGTVLGMSALALQRLKENGNELAIGDKIYVPHSATNAPYYFHLNRNKLTQTFKGIICIAHTLVEGKITN